MVTQLVFTSAKCIPSCFVAWIISQLLGSNEAHSKPRFADLNTTTLWPLHKLAELVSFERLTS